MDRKEEYKKIKKLLTGNKDELAIGQIIKNKENLMKYADNSDHPLFVSSMVGDKENVVSCLLDLGIDANIREESFGETAIFYAARHRNVRVLSLLLSAGAMVNIINNHGYTPLMEAVRVKDENVVSLLLEYGADPDLSGSSSGYNCYGIAKNKKFNFFIRLYNNMKNKEIFLQRCNQ